MPSKYLTWDDDCALRYLHAGPTTPPDVLPDWGRGSPIVFVHGEGGSAMHFLPQIEFFGQDPEYRLSSQTAMTVDEPLIEDDY